MQHLLLTLALSLVAHDQPRPPARWMPPPKPVMTLSEVVVRGQRVRHDCCSCGRLIPGYMVSWDEELISVAHAGTHLTSYITSK
jgi:hypothetical protein